jgi:hypothetical protein
MQICLEGEGSGAVLVAISGVSGTKGSTQLFIKLKVFMSVMNPNSTWARDMLMRTKQKQHQQN